MVRSKRRVQMDLIVHIISFFSTPIDVCHNSDMIMVGRLPYTHAHTLTLFAISFSLHPFAFVLCCTHAFTHLFDSAVQHSTVQIWAQQTCCCSTPLHACNEHGIFQSIHTVYYGVACVRACVCMTLPYACCHACMQSVARQPFLFVLSLPFLLLHSLWLRVCLRPFRTTTIIMATSNAQTHWIYHSHSSYACMRKNGFLSVKWMFLSAL